MNQVVARYVDGRTVKGMTADFYTTKDRFHVAEWMAGPDAQPVMVHMADLKALFFVKDFVGDESHVERNAFDTLQAVIGRRIRVVFADGEALVGTTTGYQPERPGFFVTPADPDSNIDRCYIIAAATREVNLL